MNTLLRVILPLLMLVSVNGYTQTIEEKSRIANVSRKISSIVSKLGPGPNEMKLPWQENAEVAEVLAFPAIKRIAAVRLLIWGLEANDKKMFSQVEKNQYQMAALVVTRALAYDFLRQLIRASPDDIGIKDFLDSEISDLKLIVNQKITYAVYKQLREQRSDKLTYLYMGNSEYVEAMLRLKIETTPRIEKLTNKTSAAALFDVCAQWMNLCEAL